MKKKNTKKRLLITSLGVAALAASTAYAFTASDGMEALDVIGQTDFVTGYNMGTEFFGSHPISASSFFLPNDSEYDTKNNRLFVADGYRGIMIFNLDVSSTDAAHILGQPTLTDGLDLLDPNYGINSGNPAFPLEGCDVADGVVNRCGLSNATSIVYDEGSDRLYVADSSNNRIMVWDNLTPANVVNGMPADHVLGQPDFTTGFTYTPYNGRASMNTPNPAYNECNVEYISPNIGWEKRRVNPCGMSVPQGIAYDSTTDRLFVSNRRDSRVMIFKDVSLDDGILNGNGLENGRPADSVLGQPHMYNMQRNVACGDESIFGNAPVNECGLKFPQGLAMDETDQRLYVADGLNSRVMIYDVEPNNLPADPLFAIDVDGYAIPSGPMLSIAAIGVFGQPSFGLDVPYTDTDVLNNVSCDGTTRGFGNTNACGLFFAWDVAVSNDTVYIADTFNHRILAWDKANLPLGGPSATFNHPADYVIGRSNFTDGGGVVSGDNMISPPTAASGGLPYNIMYDSTNDRLFSSDYLNHRILIYRDDITLTITGGTGSATMDGSGAIDAETTSDGGNDFGVSFPPGTDTTIVITVIDGQGGSDNPGITINATLPAGEDKDVSIPYRYSDFCIDDVPNASITTQASCDVAGGAVKIRKQDLPSEGNCIIWEEADGLCRSADGLTITIHGLENSAMFYMLDSDSDGVSDEDDVCPGTNVAGPVPSHSLRPNHVGDSTIGDDGCNCSQILEGLGINGNGPRKFGCTPGIINRWSNQ